MIDDPEPPWSGRRETICKRIKPCVSFVFPHHLPLPHSPILHSLLHTIRSFSAPTFSLLLLSLIAVPASASPHSPELIQRDGGSGNSVIPTATNSKNPSCKPWYAVRDAIMGGIYHGRCGDSARASVRLAFHDAGTYSRCRWKTYSHAGLDFGARKRPIAD
ncbi:hypothetical protein B0H19DRAFT_1273721 [Mycena capillaripes]|nr:hypothetical protein B0H19DRAFT_1273721 [Mycena capillaripes]